jgi:C-22 sterol desaturase
MPDSKAHYVGVASGAENKPKPSNLIRDFTNEEIARTLFTFLFAAQDVSSSTTIWLFESLRNSRAGPSLRDEYRRSWRKATQTF